MTDASTLTVGGAVRVRPTTRPRAMAGRRQGERLAVLTTAVAVGLIPLAIPAGPANVAPIDVFMAVAIGACLFWAGSTGHKWRFPYGIALVLFLAGGAVGALVGPVPGVGAIALIQDVWLLAWCWAVVNIAKSPSNLKTLLTTWAYSSIGWAIVPFVGLAIGSAALTGRTANQGGRIQITLADPSYAANYLFISIMIMWAIGRPRHRVFRYGAYALLLTVIAMTGSNSGVVAVIVGTVVAATLGIYRRSGIMPAITALAFIVLAGYFVTSQISLTTIETKAHDSRYAFVETESDAVPASSSAASSSRKASGSTAPETRSARGPFRRSHDCTRRWPPSRRRRTTTTLLRSSNEACSASWASSSSWSSSDAGRSSAPPVISPKGSQRW